MLSGMRGLPGLPGRRIRDLLSRWHGPSTRVAPPIRRMRWVVAGLLVLYAGLAIRLVQIQVFDHEKLRDLADAQHQTQMTLPHERGHLLDRHGRPLVISYRGWDLCVRVDDSSSRSVPSVARRATILARALQQPRAAILARLEQVRRRGTDRWMELERNVEDPRVCQLARKHPGWISVEPVLIRKQPLFPLASALLGRYGRPDAEGQRQLTGLERCLDPWLRGQDGVWETSRDGRGRRLLLVNGSREVRSGRRGADVVLTLDAELQEVVERVVDTIMTRHRPVPGAGAVVLEADTGEILALVSRPEAGSMREWPFHGHGQLSSYPWMVPLTYAVPPGSTFKPLTVGEALSEPSVVGWNDTVDCGQPAGTFGPVRIGRRPVRNYKNRRHGQVSVEEALYRSYNMGMARLAETLGPDRMAGIFSRLGFRENKGQFALALSPFWQRLGRLPGSTSPRSRWTPGYTHITWSFGQEMRLTLLDLAYAYTAVATDGRLREPVLVRRVVSSGGSDLTGPTTPHCAGAERWLFRPEVAAGIRAVLRKAVVCRDGTLNWLYRTRSELFGGHAMAAKTGTATEEDRSILAQLARPEWSGHSENILNLVVMGPVENGPARYIVALTVPHPRARNRRYVSAGQVLGPYGVEIMRFLLDRDRRQAGWPSAGRNGIPAACAPVRRRVPSGSWSTAQEIRADSGVARW